MQQSFFITLLHTPNSYIIIITFKVKGHAYEKYVFLNVLSACTDTDKFHTHKAFLLYGLKYVFSNYQKMEKNRYNMDNNAQFFSLIQIY